MKKMVSSEMFLVSGANCDAAELTHDFVVGSFAFAGGLIGAATTFGPGAPVGGFVGGMLGSGAWLSIKEDVIFAMCQS